MSRLRTVGTSVIAAVLMLGLVAGAASAQSPGPTGGDTGEAPSTAEDAPTDGATEQATGSGTESAGPGGKQITLWGGDWNTVTVLNHIAGTILEESYGYDVNYVETAFGNARASLSKDEGRIDATMEIWCINVPGWCDQHVAPAGQGGADEPAVRLSPVFENAKQGWYVPRYLVEGENAPARGLESVTQLGQFADLFASPSNPGQGRLIAGVSGWNVTEKGVIKMHALGLADDFDAQVVGSQAAMDSQVVSAFRNEEPLLLYYWKPIWVTGEYDLVKLDFPSQWSQSCQDLLGRELQEGPPYDDVPERAACEYRGSDIAPVVDADLERTDPQAYGLMDRMFVERNQIAQAAATYVTTNQSADEVAAQFLREHPQRVESWIRDPQRRQRLASALASGDDEGPTSWTAYLTGFPFAGSLNIQGAINEGVTEFTRATSSFFGAINDVSARAVGAAQRFLVWLPWVIVLAAVAGLAWAVGDWRLAAGVTVGMALLGVLGIWEAAMTTLAQILVATLISVVVGVPIGIAAARNDTVESAVKPVLDFMQTLPAFVYLVPVILLFSLGVVPAVMATVIYATPPAVRMTNLGIRQVSEENVEAARAFGATSNQTLTKVQLPLAFPTIMAGVNQVVMLALAMVVIASLVGAGGLGQLVLDGLQRQNVGLAFVGGLGIVILAMVIDRITQAAGRGLEAVQGT